jgi:purine-nucleoside phosphorylase
MSTVPEAIVAVHAGLQTFGIACITDLCLPDCLQPVDIDEIIAVASAAEPKVARLTTELVGRWQ